MPVLNGLRRIFLVLYTACYRFWWDDCFSRASALAYTTLFALVPVIAIGFYMLPFLGFSGDEIAVFLRDVLSQLLPSAENEDLGNFQDLAFTYIQQFRTNIGSLNTLSAFALIVSSIALVNTIESAVNAIWRVTSSRSVMSKVISFWAILTLGPALIAVSVITTTKLTTYATETQLIERGILSQVSLLIPVALAWFAFTILYLKMPSARVRVRDAALGGLIAAVLFDVVKLAFAYYIKLTATYSTMYGVFAFLPLFLLWIYSLWLVILLGAEISYQAGSIKIDMGRRKYATDLGEIGGVLGLRVLQSIGRRYQAGDPPPNESELAIDLGTDPNLIRTCLDILSGAGIITPASEESNSRTFLISPSKLTLRRIFETFINKDDDEEEVIEGGILIAFQRSLAGLGSEKSFYDWTLEEFLLFGTEDKQKQHA